MEKEYKKPLLPTEEEKQQEALPLDDCEKPYISASRINTYSMCGESFRRRYVEKDHRLPGTNLVKGLSGHDAAKENNSQKVESKVDLELGYLTDFAAQRVDERFALGVELNADEKFHGLQSTRGDIKDIVVASVATYHLSTKAIIPVEVEQRQRLSLPSWEKDLVYVMDVRIPNGIIDYKFTGKKKNQNDADTDLGLTAYSLAYFSAFKKLPEYVGLENFVAYKTPKNRELKSAYNPVRTSRDKEDFSIFIQRATEMLKAVGNGIFMPAQVGHWKCSPKYCEYFSDCSYVNSARRMAAEENKRNEGK